MISTRNRDNVGAFWTEDEERKLSRMIWERLNLSRICDELGRNERGIYERVRKLVDRGLKFNETALEEFYRQYEHFCANTACDVIHENMKLNVKCNGVDMKNNATWTMVSLLQENLRTVKVRYAPSETKSYTFKTRDKSINIDDFVVTNPGLKEGNFSVGQVVSIDEQPDFDPDSNLRYHWIVCKVDLKCYQALVEQDEQAYKLLIEAEKHVARKKMVDLYSEALQLTGDQDLRKLLNGQIE